MTAPSPGYSITVRVSTPATFTATSDVTNAVASTGAQISSLDVVESSQAGMTVVVSCNIRDRAHETSTVIPACDDSTTSTAVIWAPVLATAFVTSHAG